MGAKIQGCPLKFYCTIQLFVTISNKVPNRFLLVNVEDKLTSGMTLYAVKCFIPLNLLFFSGSLTWIRYGLAGGSHIGSPSDDNYSGEH